MELLARVNQDIVTALKAGDRFEAGILRLLKNSLDNASKANNGQLSEEEAAKIVKKEIKSREEASAIYLQHQQTERAAQEDKEATIIKRYAPPEASPEQVGQIVDDIIASGADSNFGVVMKETMAQLKGQADGKMVSEIVKNKLKT